MDKHISPERLAAFRKTFRTMTTTELEAIVEGRKPHRLGEDALAAIRLLLLERKGGGPGEGLLSKSYSTENTGSDIATPQRAERAETKWDTALLPQQREGKPGMKVSARWLFFSIVVVALVASILRWAPFSRQESALGIAENFVTHEETNLDGTPAPGIPAGSARGAQAELEVENVQGIKVRLLSARRVDARDCFANLEPGIFGQPDTISFQRLEPKNGTFLLCIFAVRLVDTNVLRLPGIRALAGQTELTTRSFGALTDLSYLKSSPPSVKDGNLVPCGWASPGWELKSIGEVDLRSLNPGGMQERGRPQLFFGINMKDGHLNCSITYLWPPDNDEAALAVVFEESFPHASEITLIAGDASLKTRIPYRASSAPLPSL